MGAARVTVAVPSFNQGRFLARALDSIFAQGLHEYLEEFVVQNGELDQAVAKQFRFG